MWLWKNERLGPASSQFAMFLLNSLQKEQYFLLANQ